MSREAHLKIIDLVQQAAALARGIGIPNLLQPGLVKELIVATQLKHELLPSKHGPDARDPNSKMVYEYLSCQEGGTGQLDRVYSSPPAERKQSLERLRRNQKIYFAVFYKSDPMKLKVVYELEPEVVAAEADRKLDKSKNQISHVGFSERWARENGTIRFRADE